MKTGFKIMSGILMSLMLFGNVPVYARGECSTFGPWRKVSYACRDRWNRPATCYRWERDEFKCSKQQCKDSTTDCNMDLNCLWKQSVPDPGRGIIGSIISIFTYLGSDESGVCTIAPTQTSSLTPAPDATTDTAVAAAYDCPVSGEDCGSPDGTAVV